MRHLVVGLVVVAALACGGAGGLADQSAVSGTYTLVSVKGQPLPFTISAGPPKSTLTSDVLTVFTGGSWSETGTYSTTQNGQATVLPINDGGTWIHSAAREVTFVRADGSVAYSGTFLGLTMKLNRGAGGFVPGGADVYVFAK